MRYWVLSSWNMNGFWGPHIICTEPTFDAACNYAAWLMDRPTARILDGYIVTVVEVEA